MNRKSTVAGIMAALVMFCAHVANAQEKITPSKVFQVTEDILHQLNRMHDANFTTPDLSAVRLEIPDRLPRHVIFQALNVRSKVQILQRVNGIEIGEIAPPPVREVSPQDVMGVVQTILAELTGFDKGYGLSPFKSQAKLVDGKTPTDVYTNLLKAEAMIVQLGIPGTVPNDVYNTAVSVSQDVEYIRNAVGKYDIVELPSSSFGKKPKDAYNLAYYALKAIQSIAKRDEYKIPKGVIIPKRINKGITPGDVQQILLYCLAELSSMKVKVQSTDPLYFPEPSAGQTPSTVFDQIGYVNRQIQSLQW